MPRQENESLDAPQTSEGRLEMTYAQATRFETALSNQSEQAIMLMNLITVLSKLIK
jgi:hypothetical protein